MNSNYYLFSGLKKRIVAAKMLLNGDRLGWNAEGQE